MKLKELADYIQKRLKEHNIAKVKYVDNFFQSYIDIEDNGGLKLGRQIEVEEFLGYYRVEFNQNGHMVMSADIKIDKNSNSAELLLMEILNSIVLTESPQEETKQEIEAIIDPKIYTLDEVLDTFKQNGNKLFIDREGKSVDVASIVPDDANALGFFTVTTADGKIFSLNPTQIQQLVQGKEIHMEQGDIKF